VNRIVGGFVPENCRRDPDRMRRARLIAHFGLQGTVFGIIYALFYLAIGHRDGANVIIVCTAVFAAVPWILKRTGGLEFVGHLILGTMAAGFTQLTLIEGGIHSHAVAWLASVPLCGLLVLGVRPALVWATVCFLAGTVISVACLAGLELEPLYDPQWHNVVDAAGNLGIIVFLFVLGLVFEVNRAMAFQKMEQSLGKLAISNEELASLNNEKTEFLGIAAHDLRNPLSVIIGMADFIRMQHHDPDLVESATLISKSGRHMNDLIKDLLDANAIEEGRYAEHVEPHDLRPLVLTSIEHNQHSAERKRIVVEFSPDGPPCWGQVDRKAALQVLDNLLSNALKYSPLGSNVAIYLYQEEDWIEFAVADQGPGISPEDQKKLFQKHTRLSARPTGGESSVGLGLSIVKRLAEAMGGNVRCESRLGEGSIFVFQVAAVRADSLPPGEPNGSISESCLAKV
jgi:signal transduction histidine kinase